MNVDEVLKKYSLITGSAFELVDFLESRRILMFRAPETLVSDEDISRIIAEIMAQGTLPKIRRKQGYLFLYIRPHELPEKKSKIWINIALFVATIFSTLISGAYLAGKDVLLDFSNIWSGWQYSFAVLTILTAHEMGHYLAARYHRIKVTLPYYIPLTFPGFSFGTLGAFIKIKSPIPSRPALLDVGAAGPLAGFVVSIIFLIHGYMNLPDLPGIVAYVEQIHPWHTEHSGTINIILGKSLLFSYFNDYLAGGRLPMNEIYHFPYIFSGWIGLFVTSINLIPIGQLDGGHILYALAQRRAWLVGILAFTLLVLLNIVLIVEYYSFVWVLWVVLILFLIRFRHPPTLQDKIPLDTSRQAIGWICLVIFILCFIPLPLYIG